MEEWRGRPEPREAEAAGDRLPRRDRVVVIGLLVAILALFAVYAWTAVDTSRRMRRRDALERSRAVAQLAARVVDAEIAAALGALRTAARDHGARGPAPWAASDVPAEGSSDPRLPPALRPFFDACRIRFCGAGDVVLAEALRSRLSQADALAGRAIISNVYRPGGVRGAEVVSLGVPLGKGSGAGAYLVASCPPEWFSRWLRPLSPGAGSVLYVTDAAGRVLVGPEAATADRDRLRDYPPIRLALGGEEGARVAPALDGAGEALVGYAPARAAGWAVIAVQPVARALAPLDLLERRLRLLAVPLLALMAAAAWVIERLLRRQAVQARVLAGRNVALRAADRSKSEFLARVSHDLRTPLASVKAAVSGLLEPDIEWDRESLCGFLILVDEEIDWLAARVRNLLDFTRIEAKALLPEKEACEIAEIVEAALERVEPLTRGWQLDVALPDAPLLVEADFGQIETVFLNLLENAVKYSPPGTRIRVAAASVGRRQAADGSQDADSFLLPTAACLLPTGAGSALVTVSDEGPGVPPGEEERIFEAYYRAARPPGGGTGLGLAICRAIVEAHGGAIGVRRAESGGAVFWLTLPLLPEPAPGEPEEERAWSAS